MASFTERVQEFGECEPGAIIFDDLDGRSFYDSCRVHNKLVNIGDLVQVALEGDDDENDGDCFAYCQVLAMYDEKDQEHGDGVKFEARWLVPINELDIKQQKMIPEKDRRDDELIETNVLDDIPIGSVTEHISVVQFGNSTANDPNTEHTGRDEDSMQVVDDGNGECFHVRYLQQQGTTALQFVQRAALFARGMTMSHYQYAYVEYIASLPPSDERVSVSRDILDTAGVDLYSAAIRKLHVSVLPEKLPCRTAERDYIYGALRDAIVNRKDCSKPLYISGMPGTGKTATVLATVNELRKEASEAGARDIPEFNFIEINCLRLQTPAAAYSVLWRGLTGLHAPAKKAQKLLEDHFENAAINTQANEDRKVTVCLVDEMDYLMTRSEEVVYNFFNWPLLKGAFLVVIGIANIMDLPERLTTRVASRVNVTMDRMVFKAYEHEQIRVILCERLEELQLSIFNKTTLEMVSRKAATVAGDLRAALKICQRTIELYRDQDEKHQRLAAEYEIAKSVWTEAQAAAFNAQSSQSYTAAMSSTTNDAAWSAPEPQAPAPPKSIMMLVKVAADEYKESPMMATVARLCAIDKAILVAICKHIRNSNDENEIAADMLWDRLGDLLQRARGKAGVPISPPPFIFNEALDRLVEQGILAKTGRRTGAGDILQGQTHRGPFRSVLELSDVVVALKGCALVDFI
jgi:Cdc6-like AAA superfamily ATPase